MHRSFVVLLVSDVFDGADGSEVIVSKLGEHPAHL